MRNENTMAGREDIADTVKSIGAELGMKVLGTLRLIAGLIVTVSFLAGVLFSDFRMRLINVENGVSNLSTAAESVQEMKSRVDLIQQQTQTYQKYAIARRDEVIRELREHQEFIDRLERKVFPGGTNGHGSR